MSQTVKSKQSDREWEQAHPTKEWPYKVKCSCGFWMPTKTKKRAEVMKDKHQGYRGQGHTVVIVEYGNKEGR